MESGKEMDGDQDADELSYMDRLPDELVMKILGHANPADLLLRVPRVSTRWKRLAEDNEVWKHQEIVYRACDSDEEFAESLKAVTRVGKLDLTGVRQGSAAEECLNNFTVDEQPLNPKGLELVLGDEMSFGLIPDLLERLRSSLVSLYVGAVSLKVGDYIRLMRAIDALPRLEDLRIGVSVQTSEHIREVYLGLGPDKWRPPTLKRLELWSETGTMHRAVYSVACRMIRSHKESLRSVSHEFMSRKQPVGGQEKRIMGAIGLCRNLEVARVWSSHCLKDLENCEQLRTLVLSCDGNCHQRMVEEKRRRQNNANPDGAMLPDGGLARYHQELAGVELAPLPNGAPVNVIQANGVLVNAIHVNDVRDEDVVEVVFRVQNEPGEGEGEGEVADAAPFTCRELFAESSLLPPLRRLCLRFMECIVVSNPLPYIADRCPDLEDLTLRCHTTDNNMNTYLKKLNRIRRLTLIGVHYLHPDMLHCWTEDMLPNLERLTLIGTSRLCPWVCWADAVKKLRLLRNNLYIICKECEHFGRPAPASI